MIIGHSSTPRIAQGQFRSRQSDADWDYFPFGFWARGYRVTTSDAARLARLDRLQQLIAFCVWLCIALSAAVLWPGAIPADLLVVGSGLFALLLAMTWYWVAAARVVRGHGPAERPLTWMELRRWEAMTVPLWRVLLALAVAAAFIGLGSYAAVVGQGSAEPGSGQRRVGLILLLLPLGLYGLARFATVLRIRSGHSLPLGR